MSETTQPQPVAPVPPATEPTKQAPSTTTAATATSGTSTETTTTPPATTAAPAPAPAPAPPASGAQAEPRSSEAKPEAVAAAAAAAVDEDAEGEAGGGGGGGGMPAGDHTVFVGEIARGTTDEELAAAFSRYGPVLHAEVVKNRKTSETKGYGFVTFRDLRSVEAAVDDAHDPPVFADAVTQRQSRVRVTEADPKNTIYAGRVPKSLSEDEVKRYIEHITTLPVLRFELHLHADGSSKGYGWAKFQNHERALSALKSLARAPFPSTKSAPGSAVVPAALDSDRPLSVKLAEPRTIDHRVLKTIKALYVKNVSPDCNQEELRAFFGGPTRVERIFQPTQRGTRILLGTAIVYYRERAHAEEFLHENDGATFRGRRLHVEWCLPPEVLRSSKRQQQQQQMVLGPDETKAMRGFNPYLAMAAAAAAAAAGAAPPGHPQQAMAAHAGNPFAPRFRAAPPGMQLHIPPMTPQQQQHLAALGMAPQHRAAGIMTTHLPGMPQGAPVQQLQQQQQVAQAQTPHQVAQQQQQRQLEAAALAYNQYAAAAYGFLPIGAQADPATAAAVVAGFQAAAAAAAAAGQPPAGGAARRGPSIHRQPQYP